MRINDGDREIRVYCKFKDGAVLYSHLNKAGVPYWSINDSNGIEVYSMHHRWCEPRRIIEAYLSKYLDIVGEIPEGWDEYAKQNEEKDKRDAKIMAMFN